jgi:hypothetical protein
VPDSEASRVVEAVDGTELAGRPLKVEPART